MTVGKIYAGLLIAENWKAYKTSQSKMGNVMGMVSSIQPYYLTSKPIKVHKLDMYLKLRLPRRIVYTKCEKKAMIYPSVTAVIPTQCIDSCRIYCLSRVTDVSRHKRPPHAF